ncbi:unnamed protein product, partial [Amoebophrya sp. A25]
VALTERAAFFHFLKKKILYPETLRELALGLIVPMSGYPLCALQFVRCRWELDDRNIWRPSKQDGAEEILSIGRPVGPPGGNPSNGNTYEPSVRLADLDARMARTTEKSDRLEDKIEVRTSEEGVRGAALDQIPSIFSIPLLFMEALEEFLELKKTDSSAGAGEVLPSQDIITPPIEKFNSFFRYQQMYDDLATLQYASVVDKVFEILTKGKSRLRDGATRDVLFAASGVQPPTASEKTR